MTTNDWFAAGTPVLGYDGEIGSVARVNRDPATGDMRSVLIETVGGEQLEVPASLVDREQSTGTLYLLTSRDSLLQAGTTLADSLPADTLGVGDEIVVPIHEEHVVPSTHEVDYGDVRFHKRVETVPIETMVDVKHDEIAVERIAINRPVEDGQVPAVRHEGETLIIPVLEEVLVTEKRLMLVEEIHVTRRQVSEAVPVQGSVRREYVQVERPSDGQRQEPEQSASDPLDSDDLPLT